MADQKLCELGCCEIMEGFDGDDASYTICAECGDDEHEHGKPCPFCGATGLSAEVLAAREQVARDELNAHAEQQIAMAHQDPRLQRYLKNGRTGRLIHTNDGVHRAMENKDPLVQISYGEALAMWREERATKRAAAAKLAKRKTAKASRKKNR